MIYRLIVFVIGVLLFSCSPEQEIDLPYEGDKLVVYSFLNEYEPIKVSVTTTIAPNLDHFDDELIIDHATVVLQNGDHLFDTLYYYNEFYWVNRNAQARLDYSDYFMIHVAVIGYESVSSSRLYDPQKAVIEDSEFLFGVDKGIEGDLSILKLKYSDDPLSVNYFGVELKYDGDVSLFGYWLDDLSTTDVSKECNTARDDNFGEVFSDYCNYDGAQEIAVKVVSMGENIILYVQFFSLSPELYEHSASFARYTKVEYEQEFLDPIRLYSNITNGYGVAGFYSVDTLTVRY
ncbi:MAG: DUF4249 domain-containing protein [Reichenbachiella sp.]